MAKTLRGVVKDGRLTIDLPEGFAPEGTKVLLGVLDVGNLCRAVYVPGILIDPVSPTPRVRTRCSLVSGHEGGHSFEGGSPVIGTERL
jgi:hypothetical protein